MTVIYTVREVKSVFYELVFCEQNYYVVHTHTHKHEGIRKMYKTFKGNIMRHVPSNKVSLILRQFDVMSLNNYHNFYSFIA